MNIRKLICILVIIGIYGNIQGITKSEEDKLYLAHKKNIKIFEKRDYSWAISLPDGNISFLWKGISQNGNKIFLTEIDNSEKIVYEKEIITLPYRNDVAFGFSRHYWPKIIYTKKNNNFLIGFNILIYGKRGKWYKLAKKLGIKLKKNGRSAYITVISKDG